MSTTDLAPGDMAIAICDRCRMKRKYSELRADGNSPGLRVCIYGCWDPIDPYRLPVRMPEPVALQFPRPDVPLGSSTNYLLTSAEYFEQILNTEDLQRLVFYNEGP